MNDGLKRKGQKHQNRAVFKVQFDAQAVVNHKKVSFRGLCKRCTEQMTWKVQFNKYKKMTEPARCQFCCEKNVVRSYMRACEICTSDKNVCPKCLESETKDRIQTKLNEVEQRKHDEETERKMNQFIRTLKERSRRTVKRLHEKGTIKWNKDLNNFVDEEGIELSLKYRQGYERDGEGSEGSDDIDEFGDDDSEDETEEKKEKKEKEVKKEKKVSKEVNQDKKEQNPKATEEKQTLVENQQDWSDEGSQDEKTCPESKQEPKKEKPLN